MYVCVCVLSLFGFHFREKLISQMNAFLCGVLFFVVIIIAVVVFNVVVVAAHV